MAVNKRSVAIQLATNAHVKQQPKNIVVRHEQEVFDGTLLTLTLTSGVNERDFDSFVFFDFDNKPHFFYNPAELARFLDQRRPRGVLAAAVREVFSVGGVPSLIAIIITCTICFVVGYRGLEKVPDVLGNALSVILGFYFGSKVGKDGDGGSTVVVRRRASKPGKHKSNA